MGNPDKEQSHGHVIVYVWAQIISLLWKINKKKTIAACFILKVGSPSTQMNTSHYTYMLWIVAEITKFPFPLWVCI